VNPLTSQLPQGWTAKRLRYLSRLNPSKHEVRSLPADREVSFLPMEAVAELGGLRLDATRPLAEVLDGFTYFRDGDVVTAKVTPCFENGKGALALGLTNSIGFGTTELHVLRPGPRLDRRFLFYLTMSHPFRAIGASEMYGAGGQKRVPEWFFRDLEVPVPPLAEQRAIADFLDRKTAAIDALIEKKEQHLLLMEETARSDVWRAVTKGLDRTVPLRQSGMPWLGPVPAHWTVKQLKYAATFQRGHDLPADERLAGNVPVVSSGGVIATHSVAVARGPGVVTGRYGSIGNFTYVPTDYWPLNTALYTINLRGNSARWLFFAVSILAPLFVMESKKAAVPGVDRNDLHPYALAVPPRHEQEEIAAHLDRVTDLVKARKREVRRSIDQLQEYRLALITAAVTGELVMTKEAA
jgi:type I restriction enzyme, S subunit